MTTFLWPQTTRLFPESGRAFACAAPDFAVSGIASRCDWVFLSGTRPPHTYLHQRVEGNRPRHVFLSMRAPHAAVSGFVTRALPRIEAPFVLVSGSEDATVPNQVDRRWRPFDPAERDLIARLLAHPLLLHWWAENLDDGSHPKMSPLPLGLVFPGPGPAQVAVPAMRPFRDRLPRALCAQRVRDGAQWEARRRVDHLARTAWAPFCTVIDQELPAPAFMAELDRHRFVLCVEGGGLDPAPKAWSALLHGAIPIIRDSAMRPAYDGLPVAVVPEWSAGALSAGQLARWSADPTLCQDDPALRARTLERLSLDHWWGKIAAGARA